VLIAYLHRLGRAGLQARVRGRHGLGRAVRFGRLWPGHQILDRHRANTLNAPLKAYCCGTASSGPASAPPCWRRPTALSAVAARREAEEAGALKRWSTERRESITPVGALPRRPTAGQRLTQLWSRTVFETALIFKSPAYVVLILLGFAFAMATLFFTGEIYGAPILLVTRVVITG
jgi:ABC-2 type transport system permease protein